MRIHDNNIQRFTIGGPVYAMATESPLWAAQNAKLATHWGDLPAKATVLDLGSGTGIGTLALEKMLPADGKIVGIDLTPAMVERAEKRLASSDTKPGRVEFVTGDALRLPFTDGSVHAVVANSFLYLVPDPLGVLREVHRVLAPGGRIVFMEPCAEGSLMNALFEGVRNIGFAAAHPVQAGKLAAAMGAWRIASGIIGRRSQQDLAELFAKAGLPDVQFRPTLGSLGQHVVATKH